MGKCFVSPLTLNNDTFGSSNMTADQVVGSNRIEAGGLLPTTGNGDGAARVQEASRGKATQIDTRPGQDHRIRCFAPPAERIEQTLTVRMGGRGEEVLSRGNLHHLARVENGDLLAVACYDPQIMGNDHGGRAL